MPVSFEILPPYGRQNDIYFGKGFFILLMLRSE